MERLQKLYYYPIVIFALSTVGGVGLGLCIILTAEEMEIGIYVSVVVQLIELGRFCAMGALIEICVRSSVHIIRRSCNS